MPTAGQLLAPNNVDSVNLNIGSAHGLLWAFNSLYVAVNKRWKEDIPDEEERGSGIYRLKDTNGDGELDIVFPIKNTQNNKIGFAIIHKGLYEHFIIGAGTKIKNGLSDDLNYIDIWKINKKKKNEPGLGEQKPLILKYNSIKIEKSDVGGGIVFWNGKEYEYFHQTC